MVEEKTKLSQPNGSAPQPSDSARGGSAVTNFARFYASFNKLPYAGDREELKKSIVLQYTWNRTDSLREMTRKEYHACCTTLEKLCGADECREQQREELRRQRSVCLKLLQQLGLDTTDWARVNDFCRHPRIAGKPFARITDEELARLAVKLRSILRKGGLSAQRREVKPAVGTTGYILIDPNALKC